MDQTKIYHVYIMQSTPLDNPNLMGSIRSFLIFAAIMLVLFLLIFIICELTGLLQPDKIRIFLIDHKGTYEPISFLLLAGDLFLPVPSSLVMTINGHILGFVAGSILSFSALTALSIIGYILGRLIIYRKGQYEDVSRLLSRHGFYFVLFTRPIPVLAELTCFLSGAGGMNFFSYIAGCLLGYLIISFVYSFVGSISGELIDLTPTIVLVLVVPLLLHFIARRFTQLDT